MVRFLIFNTDFVLEERKGEVGEGFVVLDDGIYLLDKSTPLLKRYKKIGKFFERYEPVYILKWNSLIPLKVKKVEKTVEGIYLFRTLSPVDMKFEEYYEIKGKKGKQTLLPKTLRALYDMNFAEIFSKYPSPARKEGVKKLLKILPFILILVGGLILALGFMGIKI